jgi:long-chain acyl-CoA synthetase
VRPHLATLVADFRRYDEQIAVVTHRGNRRFSSTYAQLAELSARCAHAFDQLGLRPGDRVLLWGNNSVEWVAAFFGCILRGIVAVPLDAAGSLELARRVVAEVQPRLLTGDLALLQGLSPGIPTLGFAGFAAGLPAPDYVPLPGLSRDTPLQIIFTSGTTGEPKGIVHTHGNVLASLDPLEKEIGKYLRYERFVHPLRILHTLPLSHVFGQFMGLWVPPLLSAETHYEDRLQAPRLVRLMHEERISVMAAVPRVLDLLRGHMEAEFPGLSQEVAAARGESIARRWWRFRALHRRLGFKFWAFVSGGATLPADLESFWTTAGFALVQGYGMTETTALVTLNHPFKIARGSIGKPLAGREVKIGPDGEILVRGDSIAAQVWQHGQMQAREEGWLATGDLATRNAEGELIFAGRKSDVIVTSAGLNIYPQDLEAVLRRQPGLREALVVGYDSATGPTPVAVLIADANGGDEVLKLAVDNANRDLAAFQQIRYWLRWPQQEFPRTSTGKVLRRTVQSWAQQALASGGNAPRSLSDPLLDLLRELGATEREFTTSDRLAEDLHLDSLATVQLQSALETRFGLELDDAVWGQVKTVGDLRSLLQTRRPGMVAAPAPAGSPVERPLLAVQSPAIPSQKERIVFPRWPWWPVVHLLRTAFLEGVMRPLLWLVLGPRIARPVLLSQPSLLIANHLTAIDVPVILYALSARDREHVAVAMSGRLLTAWRRGKAERHRMVALLTPIAYWLVTAFFNVFPLPRSAGLRQSFAHAGEALD